MALALSATQAAAQTPQPTPTPIIREQDLLDFGRISAFLGSGARALGMGGAFLARADDATAASWNPAGLSYLRRPEFSIVGVSSVFDVVSRSQEGGAPLTRDRTQATEPDFVSVAYPLSLGALNGSVQLSFQRVFSLKGDRTENNLLVERDFESTSRGGFDVLALGTGLKLSRRLRAGFTLNRWFNGTEQNRRRIARLASDQDLDFHLSGFSANLGFLFSPSESLNFGLVGKTPMHGGRVRMQRVREDVVESGARTWNEAQADDIRLDLPGAVGAGVSWRPSSLLTLSADYTRTFWSDAEIRDFFFLGRSVLAPEAVEGEALPRPVRTPPDEFPSLPFPRFLENSQGDSEELRFGAEYVFISRRFKLPVRAGYFNERQIFTDVNGEIPRYNGFTAGVGLLLGSFMLDAAYVREAGKYPALIPGDGDTLLPATVHSTLERILFSVIYRHGNRP